MIFSREKIQGYWLKYRLHLCVALAGLILAATVIAGGLLFIGNRQKIDRLISRLPLETALYVSFRRPIWPESDIQAIDSPLDFYLPKIADIFSIDEPTLAAAIKHSQRSAAVVVARGGSYDYLLYFQSPGSGFPRADLSGLPYQAEVDGLIIIGSGPEALAEALQTIDGRLFSLAAKHDFKQGSPGQIGIYADLEKLLPLLGNNNAGDNILKLISGPDINISGRYAESGWEFIISNPYKTSSRPASAIFKSLPPEATILLSGYSLNDYLQPQFFSHPEFQETAARRLLGIYGFIFSTTTDSLNRDFLIKNGDWLLFPAVQPNFFGLDFIAAFSPVSKESESRLKDLFKTLFAIYLPADKAYELPDQTGVTERYAQPENWQWEEINNDFIGKYFRLSEPKLNAEFIIYRDNDNFLITNNLNRLLAIKIAENGQISQYLAKNNGNAYFIFRNYANSSSTANLLPKGTYGVEIDNNIIIAKISEN